MPSDTVVSQRNAFKELSRLVKLGLLPCDPVVSQRKAVEELSQLKELHLKCDASEGAESVDEAWSLAVRRNSLTEQGRCGRAESVDEARSPAD